MIESVVRLPRVLKSTIQRFCIDEPLNSWMYYSNWASWIVFQLLTGACSNKPPPYRLLHLLVIIIFIYFFAFYAFL